MNTMKQAFWASPGPRSRRQALVLLLKGFCMGCADIIPGVSGGSIALIAGIYSELLAAIRSFDAACVKRLARLDFAGALSGLHLRFLLTLLMGILAALFIFAGLMKYLLENHTGETFSVFFGLMAASLFVVGRGVKWGGAGAALFAGGAVSAWFLVGLVPVTTPHTLPYIFASSVLAICAMILPGISGSFILLVLGKYEFMIGVLRSPFAVNDVLGISNALVILVFACGIVTGLALFTRFLRWLLARAYNGTLAFLVGLIAGSLRRIWPWKGEAVTEVIRGKVYVVAQPNVFPENFGGDFFFTLFLMVIGAASVVFLERLARERGRAES